MLGLEMLYGGKATSFTSFRPGKGYVNLMLRTDRDVDWWGRVILRVEDVDTLYHRFKAQGLDPEEPRGAEWGERFFHIRDPDGHELSFAQLLRTSMV